MINFGGFIDVTFLDYPGKVSSVIYLNGCPLRCVYCSNHRLWHQENVVSIDSVIKKVKKLLPYIEAVVISGGEPFLQYTHLDVLTRELRKLPILIGIETCGYYPEHISDLWQREQFDKIFLDVKTRLDDPGKYLILTNKSGVHIKVAKSIEMISERNIPCQYRTTVFKDFVDLAEIEQISSSLPPGSSYQIQRGDPTLGTFDFGDKQFEHGEIEIMGQIARKYLKDVTEV